MRFACWINKVTDARSEYVILSVFSWQQWLRKWVSLLRYTYIASLVLLRHELSVNILSNNRLYNYTKPQDIIYFHNSRVHEFTFTEIETHSVVHPESFATCQIFCLAFKSLPFRIYVGTSTPQIDQYVKIIFTKSDRLYII
jgi:hypothetical protein